jgi:hypothetical protein
MYGGSPSFDTRRILFVRKAYTRSNHHGTLCSIWLTANVIQPCLEVCLDNGQSFLRSIEEPCPDRIEDWLSL